MRTLIFCTFIVIAGCGGGGGSGPSTTAPAATAAPLEPADGLDDQVRAEARWLARELDLDAAGEARVAAALRRAWDDVEQEVARLATGGPRVADSLEEAVAGVLERRQAALDEELAAGLDPERRARFAALGGRLALEEEAR